MRCEIPILLRCCCCFPLRLGLLGWAYLKEILNLFFVAVMILKMQESPNPSHREKTIGALIILLIVSDIVFHAFFIFSAHKKDYRKIRIFYRYSLVTLCVYVIITLLITASWAYLIYMAPIVLIFLIPIFLPSIFMFPLLICFQGYLIILVRSEFMKLKNNSQFEFVNQSQFADQICNANIDSMKELSIERVQEGSNHHQI